MGEAMHSSGAPVPSILGAPTGDGTYIHVETYSSAKSSRKTQIFPQSGILTAVVR